MLNSACRTALHNSKAFAAGGDAFVDCGEMSFQRVDKIIFHAVEQFGFLRLKLRDALPR